MRRLTSALILSVFVLLPVVARADRDDDDWNRRRDRDRYRNRGAYDPNYRGNDPYYRGNDPYNRSNDPYYRGGYGGYGNGGYRNGGYGNGGYGYSPVDRAVQDLQSIRPRARVNGHDNGHFNSAMDDLYRFQQKWQSGQWDRGRLDKAIEHIQHLANSNDMYARDRQVLQNDANALRNFRASGGNGTYRNGNSGYRNGSWWPF